MNQPWIYMYSPSRSPLPPPAPPDSSGSFQCTSTCLMYPTWAGDLFPVYVFIHSFLFAMCPHLQGPYKMCPIVPSELLMWVPPSAMPFLWKCCDPLPPGSPITGWDASASSLLRKNMSQVDFVRSSMSVNSFSALMRD